MMKIKRKRQIVQEKKVIELGPEEPYSNWRSIIDKPKYLKATE